MKYRLSVGGINHARKELVDLKSSFYCIFGGDCKLCVVKGFPLRVDTFMKGK